MTENQWVGTGKGEKVAQEGAEGARKRESAHLWEWATGQRSDPPPSLSALEFVVGADFQACFGPVPVKGEKPCTPPAPPATAPAAEETSSGGERCTAGGVCCWEMHWMQKTIARPVLDSLYGWKFVQSWKSCPWCSAPLQAPTETSPPGGETTPTSEY